jgi:Fic-DOC domain mobile mystery protein B
MSNIKFEYAKGSTPLDKNEMNGLLPDYITTQEELNTLEKENIKKAIKWSIGKKHKDYLEIDFTFKLHKRMLSDVWKWAGTQRKSDKSIGIDWRQVSVQLKQLLESTKFWIENNTYEWSELAARFHHKLVLIHVFPNGNGRHARLRTEILLSNNDQASPTWGIHSTDQNLDVEGEVRDKYINALRESDKGKFEDLISFMFG